MLSIPAKHPAVGESETLASYWTFYWAVAAAQLSRWLPAGRPGCSTCRVRRHGAPPRPRRRATRWSKLQRGTAARAALAHARPVVADRPPWASSPTAASTQWSPRPRALAAPGHRGRRHRDRPRAPPRRPGPAVRRLPRARHGHPRRAELLGAPVRRAALGGRPGALAGRVDHPVLRRRAAARATHRQRAGAGVDPAAHGAVALDGRARPRREPAGAHRGSSAPSCGAARATSRSASTSSPARSRAADAGSPPPGRPAAPGRRPRRVGGCSSAGMGAFCAGRLCPYGQGPAPECPLPADRSLSPYGQARVGRRGSLRRQEPLSVRAEAQVRDGLSPYGQGPRTGRALRAGRGSAPAGAQRRTRSCFA